MATSGRIVATTSPQNGIPGPGTLTLYQSEARDLAITVTADGVAVDLTALTLRFVAQDDQVAPATVFTVEDGSITKTAAGVASILVPAASTATPRTDLTWFLRDVSSDDQVLAWGSMNIYPANTS